MRCGRTAYQDGKRDHTNAHGRSARPERRTPAAGQAGPAGPPWEGEEHPVASGRQRFSIISDGLPTQLPDIDPDETREWVDSFDNVVRTRGRARARYVMLRLLERAREQQVGVPGLRSTDYINTIPPEREPWFPGDEYVERRIRAYIRWNAAVMVSRANRPGPGRRRPHRHLRLGGQPVRGRLQPLLPRQGPRRVRRPGVLPGPRRARHLRPGLPGGPADRATS